MLTFASCSEINMIESCGAFDYVVVTFLKVLVHMFAF